MCAHGPEWQWGLRGPLWSEPGNMKTTPFVAQSSLDYNGNAARALILKVQQGINIFHCLLEVALVGYLLEIY